MIQTFILHDLKENSGGPPSPDTVVLNADINLANCKGCFRCWLKTPGSCVIHDGLEHTGKILASSNRVFIISRILYGGFSQEIKCILDRSIGGLLPFFSFRSGKMRHAPRYKTQAEFFVTFYKCSQMNRQEKELAEKIANAAAISFNASSCQVSFIEHKPTLEEVLHP